MEELLSQGDLSALKRSLNPNRPARPSARQEQYDYSTSEDDSAMEQYGREYMNSVHGGGGGGGHAVHGYPSSSNASTPEKARHPATANRGGPSAASAGASLRATGGGASTGGPKVSHVDPTKETAAPSRAASRWQVVEYDDEEESDEE